jgi:hypothetical protein
VNLFGQHQPFDPHAQSCIFQMLVLQPDGSVVSSASVEKLAAAQGIGIREGCMCNPSQCIYGLGIRPEEVRRADRHLAKNHRNPCTWRVGEAYKLQGSAVHIISNKRADGLLDRRSVDVATSRVALADASCCIEDMPLTFTCSALPVISRAAQQRQRILNNTDTSSGFLTVMRPDASGELRPVQLPVGSVRASLGYLSTFEDVYAFVRFLRKNYRVPATRTRGPDGDVGVVAVV